MKTLATPVKVTDRPLPGNLAPSVADAGPVVVVLDTGVYQGERTDGWLAGLQNDANQDELDVFPCPNGKLDFAAGHGTFIAGVIRQIDPRLRLEVERVSDSDGFAHEVTVASAMVSAVRSRLDRGGKVVLNLSLGTETMDGQPPVALTVGMEIVREIAEARGGEVLVVAAAGNAGAEVRCWPAAFGQDHDDVVAVAALDEEGEPVEWSSHGPWVKASAIGEAVLSTFVEGQEDPAIDPDGDSFPADAWAYWSGTSFAAPKVAAAIAKHSLETGCSLAEATKRVLAKGRKYQNYGSALTYFEKDGLASQPK